MILDVGSRIPSWPAATAAAVLDTADCSCCIIRASREKKSQSVVSCSSQMILVCPQVFIRKVLVSHRAMIMMTVMLLSCPKCQCHQAAGGKSHTAHMRLFYQQFNGSTHIPYSHICDDLWVCSFKWQALAAVICVKVRLQGAGVGARGS